LARATAREEGYGGFLFIRLPVYLSGISQMRLNAFLARAGVTSRRGADELIKSGRIKVNGQPGQLNDEVSDNDMVELDGKPLHSQKLRYILLYKPDRTVTTLKDTEGRPKVTDLLSIKERVVPVGRLDFDTTGALLLTNDGELAHRLMHPSFEVDKVYEAEVQGVITPKILNMLSIGIELEDGKTAPASAKKLAANKIELTIHEGRNHQVKRMLDKVGLPVRRLHRPRYGSLTLDGLKPGRWRDLTPDEIAQLKG
jgi:23S rRNA pseudouridine2605 synthase